jgi:catenin beta 1
MDYHQQYQQPQPHLQQQQQQHNGLNLPTDSTTSSEKALLWSSGQYQIESGYSTQAPSISSHHTYLDNNNDMMDNNSVTMSHQTATTTVEHKLTPLEPANQIEVTTEQPVEAATDDNAVVNWMNYQDNSEMALKAIPEMLKLLRDEDLVVVQEAAILFNQMSRNEGPRLALIQTENAVQCLVDCLNTTADLETARSLVGTLYSVSSHKTLGVQGIINSNALQPLVKMLSAPMDTIISYAITTLHNVLLVCGDKVKSQMRKMGAIHQMIPLLSTNANVKFLSIVVDCLQLLAFGNSESKLIILELGGTQLLVSLLAHNQYHKLLLNTTRLLKVLSVCSKNKQALVNYNAMQALSSHFVIPNISHDIIQNTLITLRNLSDAATRINGLEQLVQNLVLLLSQSKEDNLITLAAGILSNLTCNNENNKRAALQSNATSILLHLIQQNMLTKPQLVEPCVCALRHITNRHADMLLAQEQVRQLNGLSVITQVMCVQPRNWAVIKAVLGLVRNFCSNSMNAGQLKTHLIIEKLMQILYDAYTEVHMKHITKCDDVNLLDIIESSSASLLLLAKDLHNQVMMKDLDCIGFFVQMFYSSIPVVQRAASGLLAELSSNKQCAEIVEQQPGFHQFIFANFCNQDGSLKSISELNSSTPIGNTIQQHVSTLVEHLEMHKKFALQQQRQMQPEIPQPHPQQFQQQQQSYQQYDSMNVQHQQQHHHHQQQQLFVNNGQGQFNQQQQQQFNNQFF